MITKEKIYLQPVTTVEAIKLACEHSDNFLFIAGGTDVLVNIFQGNDTSSCLIDLTKISEIEKTEVKNNELHIGALTKLSELKNISQISSEFPVLIEAADSVGSPLIRMTATIAGNILCENRCFFYNQSEWWRDSAGNCLKCDGDICIATGSKRVCYSEFISDTAPALISMNAEIEYEDLNGSYRLKLEEIYTGDGVNPRKLLPEALIKSVILPLGRNFKSVFKKLRKRESLEFTSLTSCVTTDNQGNVNISLSGVDPKPVVIKASIRDKAEELIKEALRQSRSVENDMYSRKYRREMIGVFLKKSFEELGLFG